MFKKFEDKIWNNLWENGDEFLKMRNLELGFTEKGWIYEKTLLDII